MQGNMTHLLQRILTEAQNYTSNKSWKTFWKSDNQWSCINLCYFNPIGEDPNGIPNNLVPNVSQVEIGKLPQLNIYGIKLKYEIVTRRPGDIDTLYSDPSKAKKPLGWEAELGLDNMCADSWNFIKKNSKWSLILIIY